MHAAVSKAVTEINALPRDWHGSGTIPPPAIEAMARHLSAIGPIRRSVETGSGKSTLLFSWVSENHTVFALDFGHGSIEQVRKSRILRPEHVTFVEGSTQRMLPAFRFDEPLDAVLLDGPHGYPFPDLEYFFLYPHIRTGGLLFVDDIQIPTIRRMFDILKADDMWELVEVSGNLACFRRSQAEGVLPDEDGWWKQGYNAAHWRALEHGRSKAPQARLLRAFRRLARIAMPERVRRAAKVLLRGDA